MLWLLCYLPVGARLLNVLPPVHAYTSREWLVFTSPDTCDTVSAFSISYDGYLSHTYVATTVRTFVGERLAHCCAGRSDPVIVSLS